MKKQIEQLLKEGGELQINEYFKLVRNLTDLGNNKVDWLNLNYDISTSKRGAIRIKSREYEGIVNEVAKGIENTFNDIGEKYAKAFKNGYLSR